MIVTTIPVQQKPDVVITMSWEEAGVLRAISRGVRGRGPSQDVIYQLAGALTEWGVTSCGPPFSGTFADVGKEVGK